MPETKESDRDVETRIMLLDGPFGDDPHVRERARAAEWLVEHAERAYPMLITWLETGRAGAGAVALLPRFARLESIDTLTRLLAGPEAIAWQAGQSLAQHPQPSAGQALRQALTHPDATVAMVAADGLGTRGDRGDCAALSERLGAAHAGLRYHVLHAAARLGCLRREAIGQLARTDPDAQVRGLASQLLGEPPVDSANQWRSGATR
jgi:HEAT repeat protein